MKCNQPECNKCPKDKEMGTRQINYLLMFYGLKKEVADKMSKEEKLKWIRISEKRNQFDD